VCELLLQAKGKSKHLENACNRNHRLLAWTRQSYVFNEKSGLVTPAARKNNKLEQRKKRNEPLARARLGQPEIKKISLALRPREIRFSRAAGGGSAIDVKKGRTIPRMTARES